MGLRIEDTDAALRTDEYINAIIEPLRWLKIDWDWGPNFQSDRRDLHTAAINQLIEQGNAYYCDLTPDEIAARAQAEGLPDGYHGWSRDRDVKDGPGTVVRFRTPDTGTTEVNDIIRGTVTFANDTLGDFVIRRGDGSPMFFLANAVDDHDMAITHVIRGEDLLNTTPKVRLLWDALGYGTPPTYGHLPLLVDKKRRKLSKRRDDVSLDDFRAKGYHAEAMVNYLATLGWGPPDDIEIRPIAEIIDHFDLKDVNPAPAAFDMAKLNHFSAEYIRKMPPLGFAIASAPFAAQKLGVQPTEISQALTSLAAEIQPRVSTFPEAADWIDWIINDDISYDDKAWNKTMIKKGEIKGRAGDVLSCAIKRLSDIKFNDPELLEEIIMGIGADLSDQTGEKVLSQAPVRVAVTGINAGLPLWTALTILGKEKTLARLQTALDKLNNNEI